MKVLGLIICTALFLCQHLVYVQADGSCSIAGHVRQNCGWGGITAKQCQERGCCFDSSIRGVPWCFFGKQKEECVLEGHKRQNCGWGGITAQQCEAKGCCFDARIRGVAWCFFAKVLPTNGGYSQWSTWTQCSATCGTGQRTRRRSCTNPPPANGGMDCSVIGLNSETERCDSGRDCSVVINGGFSAWSAWSKCSATTCKAGWRQRRRTCTNPPPSGGGKDCSALGSSLSMINCRGPCPASGGYTKWSTWSGCTATCGIGQRSRSRTCTNPPPQPGGSDCSVYQGPSIETQNCDSGRKCSAECSISKKPDKLCASKATAKQCENLGCCHVTWGGTNYCTYGNSHEYKGCGQVSELSKRIVGGAHASPGEWPWHVQMHVKGNRDRHYCSGTLITPRWVITAAHCVIHPPSDISLTLGELDLNAHSGHEQTHGIVKAIKHPDYGRKPLRYDFALLKLTKPVVMNDHVRMVCLPAGSTKKLPIGAALWETGWGYTSHGGQMSDYLKELEVFIVNPAVRGGVHDSMFITETRKEGHGTCRGDSGGPVVREENGRWYLEGVHSFGRSQCAIKGQYDGQADVRTVLPWIIRTIFLE